jgi:hypothetical protein
MPRRRLILLTAGLAGLVLAAPAGADTAGFVAQEGRVTCLYAKFEGSPASLRCDTRNDVNAPPKPESCDLDWGGAFAMNRRGGAARICHGDTVIGSATRRLRYGRTWQRGGFRCRSTRARLRCENRSGHGFRLRARRHSLF